MGIVYKYLYEEMLGGENKKIMGCGNVLINYSGVKGGHFQR